MKKLLCFLLTLFLLIFLSFTALGAEPGKSNKTMQDPEIESLIKQLKDVRKHQRLLNDEIISKKYTIQSMLENKNEEYQNKLSGYNQQINEVNTSLKQIKVKKISSWSELKKYRDNKDFSKMKVELKRIILLEKEAIEHLNKKKSILDSMISVIK